MMRLLGTVFGATLLVLGVVVVAWSVVDSPIPAASWLVGLAGFVMAFLGLKLLRGGALDRPWAMDRLRPTEHLADPLVHLRRWERA
jgi:hypothetical protein